MLLFFVCQRSKRVGNRGNELSSRNDDVDITVPNSIFLLLELDADRLIGVRCIHDATEVFLRELELKYFFHGAQRRNTEACLFHCFCIVNEVVFVGLFDCGRRSV